MQNYYRILGLNSAATEDEIRRAYRILARRYHPDVNPGENSSEKFKIISEAYRVLKDAKQREQFDLELERAEQRTARARFNAYTKQARADFQAQSRVYEQQEKKKKKKTSADNGKRAATQKTAEATQPSKARRITTNPVAQAIEGVRQKFSDLVNKPIISTSKKKRIRKPSGTSVGSVSIIEASVTVEEAIRGARKTFEISEPNGARKISVAIPPGTETGNVIRLRNRNSPNEEIVLIVRVARHPYLLIERKGLVVELPITLEEAVCGASITVPTLDDQVVLKIPSGTQSGTYVRVKGKGIPHRDGTPGDLFFRAMIRTPETPEASGLKDKVKATTPYYEHPVRDGLPKTLLN